MLRFIPLVFFTACVTGSAKVPEWKSYSRDASDLSHDHLGVGQTMSCQKKLKDMGKLEGQEYSLTLTQQGKSFYKIGPTQPRYLRYYGVLGQIQYWGELPNFDLSIRVAVKDLSHVTLIVYDASEEIAQSIEFTSCQII